MLVIKDCLVWFRARDIYHPTTRLWYYMLNTDPSPLGWKNVDPDPNLEKENVSGILFGVPRSIPTFRSYLINLRIRKNGSWLEPTCCPELSTPWPIRWTFTPRGTSSWIGPVNTSIRTQINRVGLYKFCNLNIFIKSKRRSIRGKIQNGTIRNVPLITSGFPIVRKGIHIGETRANSPKTATNRKALKQANRKAAKQTHKKRQMSRQTNREVGQKSILKMCAETLINLF